MDAEAKFDAFVAGTPLPARDIGADEAAALGIRLHRSCLARLWCEPSVIVASGRPTRQAAAFFGLHSYMNDGGYLRGPVFVGRYCSIGRRVSLGAASHPAEGLSTSPATWQESAATYTPAEREELFGATRPVRPEDTLLGHDVWIGDGAVVLAGVRIGTGAIVGANAVVTADVEPYAVVGGMPARRLRMRFPPGVVERLLATRWWNIAPEVLRTLPTGHVPRFVEQAGGQPAAAIETLRVKV